MAIREWWRAAACALGLALGGATAAAPVEVYGHLPALEDVVLSPDGSRIAFVRTEGDARYLAVLSLADRRQIGIVKVGDSKLRSVSWIDGGHMMLMVSMTASLPGFAGRGEYWELLIYDLATRQLRNPLQDGHTANFIASRPMVRQVGGATRVYVGGVSLSGDSYVQIGIDPVTATVTNVTAPARTLRDWLAAGDGAVAVEEHYHDQSNDERWSFRLPVGGLMREVRAGHASVDLPDLAGFAPDGRSVWLRMVEDDSVVWRSLSLSDASLSDPIEAAADYSSVLLDRTTDRVIAGVKAGAKAELVFLDPARQARWHNVTTAFPGDTVTFVSAADDYSRIIVRLEGARDPLRYMLVDLQSGRATALGEQYEGLDVLAEQRSISYAAADGLKIQAFLTLPPGRPEKSLPLIVLPHGGPAARDVSGFDWWAQALAAQGYVVLQPNYRGSISSRALQAAGFGEFGRKMQSDLSDGVRFLAAAGMVDPRRVCIVGASYGGYAALAGVTLDPGVYRCAVSVAGLSELRDIFADAVGGLNHEQDVSQRFWDRYLGVSGPRDPKLALISPLRHVDAITAPVLLIHGRDDTVVPFSQSEKMANAMKKAGKPVEFVVLKGEDHWLSRTETRLQMLQATVNFLKANNPPD